MKIAVVGCGVEGKSVVKYFGKRRDEITICDINGELAKLPEAKSRKASFRVGQYYLDDLNGFDLIFRSPGIPYLKQEFNSVRKKLTSATKYFFEKCPCKIVGVTGTKGKGTTASLIYEMLRFRQGYGGQVTGRVFLGGNIGASPLDFLDELRADDIVILELSSFQLQDLEKSPFIAVALGVNEDHLDHHKDFNEYIEAKKNIVKFQKAADFAVLDADNEISNSFSKNTKAKVLKISLQPLGADGCFIKAGKLIFKKGKTGVIFGEKNNVGLIGEHNLKNILAAGAVANLLGARVDAIEKAVRGFKGLPHRLEFAGEVNGVKFYNDSASTNPTTAIAALRAFNKPLILIAGGSEKNADFALLGEEIAKRKNVKTVILMGQTKSKIEQAIETACAKNPRPNSPLEIISADSYMEAFMVAKMLAREGDIVLLSPACASFDMFKNYTKRGDIFKSFVLGMI
ncbi:UDP-N-acetylmuramoyl-L-alanine--D-glutamate ligase [Candidatus Peregrinibacteria bacterium]|nr:UDP-N-acetylmuramoyl-L-alanine--D-glutamate ligase [Candidatus Peregrinibacteria bacterium]